jgi:hypothetical protein
MNDERFDAISRALTTLGSRRDALRALPGMLLGEALLGPSPNGLVAAPKKKGKATGRGGNGRGDPRHDRHGRKALGKKKSGRQQGQEPNANGAPTAESVQDAAPPESGGVGGEEITAASHGCRHAGVRCKRGSQCCTGKCLRSGGKKKCSCDTSNPCPTPADPCKTAVCSAIGRCDIQNKCVREAPETCGQTGVCDAGTCQLYGFETVCASAPECYYEDTAYRIRCDGNGECIYGQEPCSTGFCNPATRACGPCSRDVDCGPPFRWCDNGSCQHTRAPGDPCSRPGMCRSGFCVGGVCCASACVPTHATASCAGGTCVLTCAGGWDDCDNDTSNGCETDLRASDPMNCGACGLTCTCRPGLNPECQVDQCACTG